MISHSQNVVSSSIFLSLTLVLSRSLFGGLIVYDSPDGVVDPNKWTTIGTVTEPNSRLNVWGTVTNIGTTSIAWTRDNVDGDPIRGFRSATVISNPSGGLTASATGYIEITNDTDFIRFRYERATDGWRVSSSGTYGNNGNIAFVPGEQLASPEVKPDGSDLVILTNDIEIFRFSNTSLATNSFFRFYVQGINGSGGEDYSGEGIGPQSNGLGLAGSNIVSFYIDDEVVLVPEPSGITIFTTLLLLICCFDFRLQKKMHKIVPLIR